MTTIYFGEKWDAPILDEALQVALPNGRTCMICEQAIVRGDRGFVRGSVLNYGEDTFYVHRECELLGILGHDYGVCSCTGYDTSCRDAALELWRRLVAAGGCK